jgi:DNA polymerase III delta subunit
VLRNPGPFVKRNEDRDVLLGAIANVAVGNGLAVIDVHDPRAPRAKRRFVPHKRLADSVAAAGGVVRQLDPPKGKAFPAFIEREARDRGLTLGPGAAAELATRVGGSATDDDVDRRYQTRRTASELDKLALRHEDGRISVDDVRELVGEDLPSSLFALTDAIGPRRADLALEALGRVLDTQPEPVILVMLHRRVRELLEVGDRLGRGQKPAEVVAATGLHPYVVERMESQARNWTTTELADALDGLLELDAMVKHAPGYEGTEAQRRLAFTLWVMAHVPRRARQPVGSG